MPAIRGLKTRARSLRSWLECESKSPELPEWFWTSDSDDISISSSLQAEISSTPDPNEVGEDSHFLDGHQFGHKRYAPIRALPSENPDRESSVLGAGTMFDDLTVELERLEHETAPAHDETLKTIPGERISSAGCLKWMPLTRRISGHMNRDETWCCDPVALLAIRSPVTLDPDDYYKGHREKEILGGSETSASNNDGTKGSLETDTCSAESCFSMDVQRKINQAATTSGTIDLCHMNPGGENLDRLALCFDKETIQLIGRTDIMPQQNGGNGNSTRPDLSQSKSFPEDADQSNIDQSQAAEISTAKSNGETAVASSKATPSSDDTESEGWLSDLAEVDPVLDDDHPFLKHKNEILVCALRLSRRYLKVSRCPAGPSEEGTTSNPKGSDSTPSNPSGRKRSNPGATDEAPCGGGSDKMNVQHQASKKPRVGGTVCPRFLACPYYKRNKLQHIDCLKLKMKRVKDVKQHLWRTHRQPLFYCSICYDILPSAAARDVHVRQLACEARERPSWDGISEELGPFLSQRVDAGISLEDQWFSVWDIIFPNIRRPASAFLEGPLEEIIAMVRESWDVSGPQLISTVLGRHGLLNWTRPGEERDLAIMLPQMLNELLGAVLDEFQRTAAAATDSLAFPSEGSGAGSSTSVEEPPPLPTPAQSMSSARRPHRRSGAAESRSTAVPAIGESMTENLPGVTSASNREIPRIFNQTPQISTLDVLEPSDADVGEEANLLLNAVWHLGPEFSVSADFDEALPDFGIELEGLIDDEAGS